MTHTNHHITEAIQINHIKKNLMLTIVKIIKIKKKTKALILLTDFHYLLSQVDHHNVLIHHQ